LRGGVISLEQDLKLKGVTTVDGWGSVLGDSHRIDLCSSVTGLPNASLLEDTTLIFNDDLILSSSVTCRGDCVIFGKGHSLILTDDAALIVESGGSLEIRDVLLLGVKNTNIRCVDDSASIILDTVEWVQSQDYQFNAGSFLFKDSVDLLGSATFIYASSQTSTLADYTQLYVTEGMHLCIGRADVGSVEPLYFQDSSSSIKFDNCTWIVSSSGMQLTKGSIIFDNNVDVDVQSTSSQNGLVFGNGILADDVTIICKSGARVNHIGGHITYNNNAPNGIISTSKSARLVRQENSYIVANTDVIIPEITLELVSELVPPLIIASAASLLYSKTFIVLPDVEYDFSGGQINAYTYLLRGDDDLFLTKGILPLLLQVDGLGNILQGNGGASQNITLVDSTSQLQARIIGSIMSAITLNQGTLQLLDNLYLSTGGTIYGPGTVDLGSYVVDLGSSAVSYDTPILWEGSFGSINFSSKLSLSSTWTISGKCTLNGNGTTLELLEGGQIVVANGTELTLKRLKLKGVAGTNITCSDSAGSIKLVDCHWLLDEDFTFSTGSFRFARDNTIEGNKSFIYDSSSTSTIADGATIKFVDVNLNIGRKTVDGNEPLYFEDETAILHLDNAQLTVPSTGLQLSRGTVVATRDIITEVHSTSTNAGLEFGDGTPSGDITILFLPGSTNRFTQGHTVYNVTDTTKGIVSTSRTAELTRGPGTVLYVKEDVNFKNVTVEISPLAQIIVESGKTITFDNVGLVLPTGELLITGQRFSSASLLLAGGDIIDIVNGTLPLATFVLGTNTMQGSGGIDAPIILQNSDSILKFGVGGSVFTDIVMNGGSIVLMKNLVLGNEHMLSGVGTVTLGSNNFDFGRADLHVTSTITWHGTNGALNLHGATALTGKWIFDGDCIINGNGQVVNLTDTGEISVLSGASLAFRNIQLQKVHDQNINCVDDSATLKFDNVEWIQSDDYLFDKGSILFDNYSAFIGPHTFCYSSARTSTINTLSELHMLGKFTFQLNTSDMKTTIAMEDATSFLHFEDSTLTITGAGARFTRGRIICENDVTIEPISTSTANGLVLGDGTLEGDLQFQFFPGTTVRYPRGHVLIDLVNPASITSTSNISKLIRGDQSFYHLKNDVLLKNLTLQIDFNAILTQEAGKVLSFVNVTNETPVGNFDITGIRYSAYGNLLAGAGNFLFLSRGAYPLLTIVSGVGNSILGNGIISGPIIFDGPTADLAWSLNGSLLANITLNGGLLKLDSDLILGSDVLILGSGEVNLQGKTCVFGGKEIHFSDPLYWNGNGGTIEMNHDIYLDTLWTFSGVCTIQGNGHILDLGTSGTIIIENGSQLIVHDLTLENVADGNVLCANNASIFMLDDMVWRQRDNYIFDVGALQFKNKVKMQGQEYIFGYQSVQTSTVLANSTLKIDTNFTFSCDVADSKEVLEFIDNSSGLFLSDATLHTTTTGINLTNGTLYIQNNSRLRTESMSEGVTFGDSMGNDCVLLIYGGSTLSVEGALNYKNTNQSSLIMKNKLSNIHMQSGSHLNVYEDIYPDPGYIAFENNSVLANLVGKKIIGSISPFGRIIYREFT
jgi:hypothetical protein